MNKLSYFVFYVLICLFLTNCKPPKIPVEQTIPDKPVVTKKEALSVIEDKAGFQQILAEQKGKVTLVNLWATWCKPCVYEMPALEKLHQNYKDKGVKIIAVSLDELEKTDSLVRPYWESNGFSMDAYIIGAKDPSTILTTIDPFWMGVIPTSFILNAKGEKVETISGTLKYEGFEEKILAVLNAN
ncbi:MAG: TlpA disulfide reductase family protein [Saprospiraceae bacterium]